MAKATGANGQLPKMKREEAAILVQYLGERMLRLLTEGEDPEEPWTPGAANLPDQGRSSGDEDNPTAASRGPASGDRMGLPGMKGVPAGLIRKTSRGDRDLRDDLRKIVYKVIYSKPFVDPPLAGRRR
jgi:hypothetical protein